MKVWGRCSLKRAVLGLVLFGLIIIFLAAWNHQDSMDIKVAVVEEHHEVLPYWFEAAEDGLIPTHGNILVHIDGHSDESTPEYLQGMPFFKWPKTDQQMGLLLQKNDIFIQAAVMAGLISRVIWIYPSWDQTIKEKYSKSEVKLGWMKVREGDVISPYFCECLDSNNGDISCLIVNLTLEAKSAEQEIDPELCHAERTYISEHVRDDEAQSKFAEQGWIPEGASIIVDIDEDYFGCDSGAKTLTASGVKWKLIEQLNVALESFMCPTYPEQEDMADDVLRNIIVFYQRLCKWDEKGERCLTSIKHLFVETAEKIVHFWRKHPSLFCARNDLVLRNKWRDMLRILFSLTRNQLQAIVQLGFCYRTSPVSLGFGMDAGELRICHGVNIPNDTIVYLHRGTEEEVRQRSVDLSKLLADNIERPKLVTICRSVRDGFTPRDQAAYIEELVLNSLSNSYSKYSLDLQYDVNLLGGDMGWPSRSKHSVT